jgi:hypothetical protein
LKNKLKIINGGLHKVLTYQALNVIAAPDTSPPFTARAIVYEEDTFLIMSEEPGIIPPPKHPIRLMAELDSYEPETPGSIVIKGSNPVRILAVVHDVNMEPTWREDWIEAAMEGIFKEVEKRKIQSLGLPVLGAKYGNLKYNRFTEILASLLKTIQFQYLEKIWLIAPVPVNADLIMMLKKSLNT